MERLAEIRSEIALEGKTKRLGDCEILPAFFSRKSGLFWHKICIKTGKMREILDKWNKPDNIP